MRLVRELVIWLTGHSDNCNGSPQSALSVAARASQRRALRDVQPAT